MDLSTQKILIFDPHNAILGQLARQIASLACQVIPTASAKTAMETLKKNDVAVTVVHASGKSVDIGELGEAVHDANPSTVCIAVISTVQESNAIKAADSGKIWRYLVKPVGRAAFLSAVKAALGQSRKSGAADESAAAERPSKPAERDVPNAVLGAAKRMSQVIRIVEDKSGMPRIIVPQKRAPPPLRVAERKASRLFPLEFAVGTTLGERYRLEELLGVGGVGKVFRATDLLLNIPVAVKMLNSTFQKGSRAVADLKREALIAMSLSHRHIVRLYNLEMAKGIFFMVMEYVAGRSFRKIIQQYGRVPLQAAVQIVEICADVLDYAHEQGILHRDLKPENLLLTNDGILKVIDFGIAMPAGGRGDPEMLEGTVVYMSPEQIRGDVLDSRTDVYSLGMTAYELLTGKLPFEPNVTFKEIMAAGQLALPELRGELRDVIEKAVAFNRDERWESASAFSAMLSAAVMASREPA